MSCQLGWFCLLLNYYTIAQLSDLSTKPRSGKAKVGLQQSSLGNYRETLELALVVSDINVVRIAQIINLLQTFFNVV